MRLSRAHTSTTLTELAWLYAAGVAGFYALASRRARPIGEPLTAPEEVPELADETERSLADVPFVSVIVPARDEERNIVGCVESLLSQQYPRFEIIVVDDGSTDRTPELLEQLAQRNRTSHRVRTLRVQHLPEGWAGKPHALHEGVGVSRGEWLLFTDADTRHSPQALATTIREAHSRKLDLLSLGTRQELPDFWGKVLMPVAYMGISFMYPERQVNDPSSPVAIANGQYILLRRRMYQRIGGYAAPQLRATVLDDRDLAVEVKRHGGRMAILDGRALVQTRMYHSLGEHWEGWGKNAYAGSRGGPLIFLGMLVGLPLVTVGPFALLFGAITRRMGSMMPAGILAALAALWYRRQLDDGLGIPRRFGWTHPLGGAIFTAILARSFWRVRTGRGVSWRGRTYQP